MKLRNSFPRLFCHVRATGFLGLGEANLSWSIRDMGRSLWKIGGHELSGIWVARFASASNSALLAVGSRFAGLCRADIQQNCLQGKGRFSCVIARRAGAAGRRAVSANAVRRPCPQLARRLPLCAFEPANRMLRSRQRRHDRPCPVNFILPFRRDGCNM